MAEIAIGFATEKSDRAYVFDSLCKGTGLAFVSAPNAGLKGEIET